MTLPDSVDFAWMRSSERCLLKGFAPGMAGDAQDWCRSLPSSRRSPGTRVLPGRRCRRQGSARSRRPMTSLRGLPEWCEAECRRTRHTMVCGATMMASMRLRDAIEMLADSDVEALGPTTWADLGRRGWHVHTRARRGAGLRQRHSRRGSGRLGPPKNPFGAQRCADQHVHAGRFHEAALAVRRSRRDPHGQLAALCRGPAGVHSSMRIVT